jgi:YHYH protein/Secretion system C-terminal sorting domain
MINKILIVGFIMLTNALMAQSNPVITAWLQNTSQTGTYYKSGSSVLVPNNILVNCQSVDYSNTSVYVTTKGIPAYPTGPFLDGNPSIAQNQNAIFKLPLNPQKKTGTPTNTTGGNIGIFINGVALFDYRDGVAWNSTTNSPCGGPGNAPCPGGMNGSNWNRDAIVAERKGFDCAKGHPAMGNYHHHQNPSAFKLDLNVVSDICNLYDADGLYVIDSNKHSPLIGFAYDGFPIYGAYAYKNTDGSGGITRMKSSYTLRAITERTTSPSGATVSSGPPVNATYPLGYYREDYQYNATSAATPDYLDEHNGRFCITPEYPSGIYCYFATVDDKWNSAYPYVVGPTFYGAVNGSKVQSIAEAVTNYKPTTATADETLIKANITILPNPASDIVAIQIDKAMQSDVYIELRDVSGKTIMTKQINQGTTIGYFDLQAVYAGNYIITLSDGRQSISKYVTVVK